jgi:hypothetical protein
MAPDPKMLQRQSFLARVSQEFAEPPVQVQWAGRQGSGGSWAAAARRCSHPTSNALQLQLFLTFCH